jgi:hypothetical protein
MLMRRALSLSIYSWPLLPRRTDRMSASGGLLFFARSRSDDKVTPKAAIQLAPGLLTGSTRSRGLP